MRIESKYPTPILGVSTLAPRNRANGLATSQVNFRSDPVNKLNRRPSLRWEGKLFDTAGDIKYHSFRREGKDYSLVIEENGTVHGYVDGVEVTVEGNLATYIKDIDQVKLQTIESNTYVVDSTVVTKMDPKNDTGNIQKVSHLNITAALNYSESVTVNVTKSDGSTGKVTYTVPPLGTTDPDYDKADKARATTKVAEKLAEYIRSGTYDEKVKNPDYDYNTNICATPYIWEDSGDRWIKKPNPDYDPNNLRCQEFLDIDPNLSNVTAVASGSTVAVWEDGRAEWISLTVDSGQGDRTTRAFNHTIEDVEGLPLYAVHGTRIKVQPNPTTDDGTYFLEAQRTPATIPGGSVEEVVWAESRDPEVSYEIVAATMPHIIEYDSEDNKFVVKELDWADREVGDEDSCPIPSFMGKTINQLGLFQERLVLVAGNSVSMSRSEHPDTFWKRSAIQLLVSDTFSVESSAVGIDALQSIVPHNRDLLISASNGQFKISGEGGVSPETVAMPLTTSYEIQTDVDPISLGSSVFLPISYGESSGLQEYTGRENTTQDTATPISHHVMDMMRGTASMLTGSSNLDMLAFKTTGSKPNEIFIYEQFTVEGESSQNAWSTWVLPVDNEVLDMKLRADKLTVIVKVGTSIFRKVFYMYARVATQTHVHLDDLLTLETNGTSVVLPDHYDTTNIIAVRGEGTKYQWAKAQFTLTGNTMTFNEDISKGTVYIGRTFRSSYEPTRPFRREDNQVITSDRLRVARFTLGVVGTYEISMATNSEYYDQPDQHFNSRTLGTTSNKIGVISAHTGDVQFSFAQDAAHATPEFYTDGFLPVAIVSIDWSGQYYKSSGRM